jgi:hypothetical protein
MAHLRAGVVKHLAKGQGHTFQVWQQKLKVSGWQCRQQVVLVRLVR